MEPTLLRRLAPALLALALAASPALGDGYTDDFSQDFDGLAKKMNDLAAAFPAGHYGWRPAEDIRSVSESIVHVANTNFFLAQVLGVPMPEDFRRDAEKTVTAKPDVMALLAASQDHVRRALAAAGADLDEPVELFGGERSKRGVLMRIVGHNYEHLGQLIAYARSSDVVPPWSR